MRNFSKVYLLTHSRQDFHFVSMTENRSADNEYEPVDTIFYIPSDAKLDGV